MEKKQGGIRAAFTAACVCDRKQVFCCSFAERQPLQNANDAYCALHSDEVVTSQQRALAQEELFCIMTIIHKRNTNNNMSQLKSVHHLWKKVTFTNHFK